MSEVNGAKIDQSHQSDHFLVMLSLKQKHSKEINPFGNSTALCYEIRCTLMR